jgi:hypothetical protein
MGNQIGLSGLFERAFQPRQPAVQIRMIPIILDDTPAARLIREPMLLPMPFSRAEKPGKNKYIDHLTASSLHPRAGCFADRGKHLTSFIGSARSPEQTGM